MKRHPQLAPDHWLGTGAIAKMLHIGRNEVIRILDEGYLSGRRQANGFRQARRQDVLAFMQKYGIPE